MLPQSILHRKGSNSSHVPLWLPDLQNLVSFLCFPEQNQAVNQDKHDFMLSYYTFTWPLTYPLDSSPQQLFHDTEIVPSKNGLMVE